MLFLKTRHLVLVATCIFLPDDDANGALYECHVSILYLLVVITFFFIAIGCHHKQHSLFFGFTIENTEKVACLTALRCNY